jgi:hypothetical protein
VVPGPPPSITGEGNSPRKKKGGCFARERCVLPAKLGVLWKTMVLLPGNTCFGLGVKIDKI